MATEFILPDLGETVKSGTLAKVLVSVGDRIEEGQPVLELETDKAIVEVPSNVSGTVQEIAVNVGDKIEVGQKVFVMGAGDDGSQSAPEQAATAGDNPTRGEASPDIGVGEGTASEAVEPAAQSQGMGGAGMDAGPARTNGSQPKPTTLQAVASTPAALIPAPPSVRRLAREVGVDIQQVAGSGPHGRITFTDIKNHMQRSTAGAAPSLDGGRIAVAPLPDFSKWGEVERQPFSNVRRATAEQMARSWTTVPHVTQFDKADITELEKLRKGFAKKAEAAGGKLTVTAIALKIVASALKKFPQFNASIDMASQEVVYKKYVHVGVAVDTDRGLLVPVIRDVDQKNIVQLSAELTALGEKARSKKTSLDDMQGGSFTITNLGGIGGTGFTPIVNTPEVAILGLARGGVEPVFIDGKFEPRTMLPLSLSYDHRLIDGADGARFLRWIASALEQPFLLSLEG
jgi:pyruvate dehydrogenase E2 component (dihydrolipoamide acetyltransferase)